MGGGGVGEKRVKGGQGGRVEWVEGEEGERRSYTGLSTAVRKVFKPLDVRFHRDK